MDRFQPFLFAMEPDTGTMTFSDVPRSEDTLRELLSVLHHRPGGEEEAPDWTHLADVLRVPALGHYLEDLQATGRHFTFATGRDFTLGALEVFPGYHHRFQTWSSSVTLYARRSDDRTSLFAFDPATRERYRRIAVPPHHTAIASTGVVYVLVTTGANNLFHAEVLADEGRPPIPPHTVHVSRRRPSMIPRILGIPNAG